MKTRNILSRLATAAPAVWVVIASIATAQAPQTGPISQGVFTHDGEAFRVVNTAGFRTAADSTASQRGAIEQVGLLTGSLHRNSCDTIMGSCDTCGTCTGCMTGGACMTGGCSTGSCGTGSCGSGSCGCNSGACNTKYTQYGNFPYGYYDGPLFDRCYNPCNKEFNPCGTPCCPYSYASVDFLFMDRDGDGAADFDWEPGVRGTIGKMPDCGSGWEFTAVGLLEYDANDTTVIPTSPTTADVIVGEFDSLFYSFELNRTLVSQDVAKLYYGIRYIQFDEDVSAPALVPAGAETGMGDVDNSLIGGQIGGDFYFPVSTRAFMEMRGRAGAYINIGEYDAQVDAFTLVDEEEDIAGFFEFGLGLRYMASERLTIRGAGEVWYLAGVATIQNELREGNTQVLLNQLDLDEGVVFYGLSVGAELKF